MRRLFAAAVMVAVVAGLAWATTGSGTTSTLIGRATFGEPVKVKRVSEDHDWEVKVHAKPALDIAVQTIVFQPGGHSGWHSHPGPVVVLVKVGELTLYDGEDPTCTGRTYSAGQAFVDRGQGHVHIARNLSPAQNVELWVTYFDVPVGGGFRVDADDPGNCDF